MDQKEDSNSSAAKVEDHPTADEYEELLQTLEQQTLWSGHRLVKYRGFWCPVWGLRPILSCRKHFKSQDTDIILTSVPKSGTTWWKALIFSIVNRNVYTLDQSPLLTSNPHELVPFLDVALYREQENPDLGYIRRPRIFSTHLSYQILPQSILESECKIIYICRNPLDQFVSNYHFSLENRIKGYEAVPLELDEAFDMFSQGIDLYGSIWEHILGYWNAHLTNPSKLLFLKYEDLKEDITTHAKKIAEFLGFPFSEKEEKQGIIDQITSLCSFETLSSLEVNKTNDIFPVIKLKKKTFFRKGEVGDWTNYLTPGMAEEIKEITESKFKGSSLTFKT